LEELKRNDWFGAENILTVQTAYTEFSGDRNMTSSGE